MTDHLYREIEELRRNNELLSKALADMISMYESKTRHGAKFGNARAALNQFGSLPKPQSSAGEPTDG